MLGTPQPGSGEAVTRSWACLAWPQSHHSSYCTILPAILFIIQPRSSPARDPSPLSTQECNRYRIMTPRMHLHDAGCFLVFSGCQALT